ncbi:MAG: hypothetical protein R2856_25835 [Caldilineaceae bacterium]
MQIGLRWLPLFVLVTAAGLLTSKLVSRGGSYLVMPLVLAVLFTVDEWRGVLDSSGLGLCDHRHACPPGCRCASCFSPTATVAASSRRR